MACAMDATDIGAVADRAVTDRAVTDRAVVDRADAVDAFRLLRGYERDLAFMRVEREMRRLREVQAAMLFEVAESVSYVDDGHHTPSAWFQAVTNSSRSSAAHTMRVASMLAALPRVAASLEAGEIGDDQLRLLVGLHANPRCGHLLANSEDLLLEHARSLPLRDFRVVCQRWLAHTDADGAHRDHEASRANRHVSNSQVGAGHHLQAEGDALSGDIMMKVLDEYANAEFQVDIADRRAAHGELANEHPLGRTARQRRYDAMLAIFLKAAGAQTASGSTRAPLVNILTNEATLYAVITNYYGDPDPATAAEPPTSHRMWLCQTTSGAPVDPADLMSAVLIGHIRRVITDSVGRVIDLGRRSRLFTGAAREAALLMGNRCCWPGCGHPGVEIDHLQPWARDGMTSPTNSAPLCARHNRYKHTHDTTIGRTASGWHHFRPDGKEITPVKFPHEAQAFHRRRWQI